MKSGNGLSKDKHNGTYILVEGPSWGDAEFYGRWLLDAAKVNQLLQQAKRDDPDFRKAIDLRNGAMFGFWDHGDGIRVAVH